jgi:hypothetical protein
MVLLNNDHTRVGEFGLKHTMYPGWFIRLVQDVPV